jgi:hypothetical protein
MQAFNVIINNIVVGLPVTQESEPALAIYIELRQNPNLTEDNRVLVTHFTLPYAGWAISQLLNILEIPNINLTHGVAAVLQLDQKGEWTLQNIVNENKKFNPRVLAEAVEIMYRQSMSPAPTEQSDSASPDAS